MSFTAESLPEILTMAIIGGGLVLPSILGLLTLCGFKPAERTLSKTISWTAQAGIFISAALAFVTYRAPGHGILVEFGNWFQFENFSYHIQFWLTRNTTAFLFFAHCILAAVLRFSENYLHKDPAYQRFILLISFLQWGIACVALAANLDLLFFGWELVGVASFLLVGFFTSHRSAGRQSLKAFITYKISDIGIILAGVFLHNATGHTNLAEAHELVEILVNSGQDNTIFLVCCLIFWGSMAKGGVFPLNGWFPRALEGPTPSSAIFYGALSVHLAPILLIKTYDLWSWNQSLRIIVFAIGFINTLIASKSGQTQSNVKTQLAHAVMTQIGIMYMVIALGWRDLAVIHICSHAILRTIQYLRSGSVLQAFHENKASYLQLQRRSHHQQKLTLSDAFFIHAWNGFYVDALTTIFLVNPVRVVAKLCHRILSTFGVVPAEHLTSVTGGGQSRTRRIKTSSRRISDV